LKIFKDGVDNWMKTSVPLRD